jgi:hypothetical protein
MRSAQETDEIGSTSEFMNSDGTPATWLDVLSPAARRKAFAWRFAIGTLLAAGLWAVQIANGAFDLDRVWIGLVPLGVGTLFGYLAHQVGEVRRYSMARVRYSHAQRLNRAWKYWAVGSVVLALAWGYQLARDQFAEYWWYAWPVAVPFLVGTGLYLLRGELTLTPAAAKAKSYFDALQQRAKEAGANPGALDRLLSSRWVRYPGAAVLLYGAYYFGFVDTGKKAGMAALSCLVLAGLCAYEASIAVLVVALVIAIGWALFAGISALPVSAAIVIGALIIASALRR